MLTEYHILSLGAGVQSTTVYLLAMEGEVRLDCAIFADTQDEPKAVYKHLEWLQSLNGPSIHVVTKGRLSSQLTMLHEDGKRRRFAAVPFFTLKPDGEIGQTLRQCSKDFKVEVVERCIRRTVLGLQPRQRVPRSTSIHQYFGISADEARRAVGIKKRVSLPYFPLIDRGWTRADCLRYLESRVPHQVPRSACVYCPFHSDSEWMKIRQTPEDWELAVSVDNALRVKGAIINRNMSAEMFAHRTCVPLEQVKFRHERQFNLFTLECEGVCGV